MPVFTEFSTSSRDLRVLPSFAPPVPRLSPTFEPKGPEEKYEVVIVGVCSEAMSIVSGSFN
jgi:phenol 2-monooxygenase